VRNLIDDSGDLVDHIAYSPFGQQTPQSVDAGAVDFLFGYDGEVTDAVTGEVFADYRIYDPAIQRWDQPDPTGLLFGPNSYEAYGNSPTNFGDPSGLQADGWYAGPAGADYFQSQSQNQIGPLEAIPGALLIAPLRGAVAFDNAYGTGDSIPYSLYQGIGVAAGDLTGVTAISNGLNGTEVMTLQKFGPWGRAGEFVGGGVGVFGTATGLAGATGLIGGGGGNVVNEFGAGYGGSADLAQGGTAGAELPTASDGAANSGSGPSQIFSGHGLYDAANGLVTIPDGTSVSVFGAHGSALPDSIGGLLDQGILPSADQIVGGQTYLPGAQIPNYTLFPPDGLSIMGSPTTVTSPTTLAELLTPNQGNVWWSACQSIK
jgi:RHS repeat-associated protein